MFVRSSTHERLRADHLQLKAKHEALTMQHAHLMREWNDMVATINRKGGQAFLDSPPVSLRSMFLSKDDVKRMLVLCHPDKHNGKESAKLATQKLLQIREYV